MQRRTKLLAGVLAGVLVVGGAGFFLSGVAPVATGYAAKIACSGHYLQDRTLADMEEDLPSNPLVPFLRLSKDDGQERVRASLLGLWATDAWFTSGIGCTLSDERPELDPILTVQGGTPWPEGLPANSDVVEPQLLTAVASAFAENVEGKRKNTRAVVVVHEGRVIAERYASGFDEETPLLGWSMTKSVANALVGRLVHEGEFSVEEASLREDWAADSRASITIEHLLQMSSGLAFEEVYDPGTDATQMLFRPGSAAAFAAAKPLVADPGTRWSYSSGTSNILCDVLHERTGAGPELARDLLFDPLGMSSAVLEPDETGGLICSSSLYATARDWARFGRLFLNDGVHEGQRLLPEGWVDYSTTPVALETENPYGAHWWLNSDDDGTVRMPGVPEDAFWASGNEGQHVVVVPSRDLVVVRLGLTHDFDGIEWGLEDLLVGIIDSLG